MDKRLKKIRLEKGLTQTELGSILGLSKSAISKIELNKASLTDRNMQALAKELDVNPIWLKTGDGEMFLSIKEDLIDQLAKEYKLDQMSKELIRSFLELDHDQRDYLIGWLKNVFAHESKKEEQ